MSRVRAPSVAHLFETLMTPLYALIIGFLQGLTEFFPVSSSAHLKLAKHFLGISPGENLVVFDLICHLGTLIAILFFFRKEILELFFAKRQKLLLLLIATLPLFPSYFLLKSVRETASRIEFLGPFLMLTGLILFAGERLRLKRSAKATPLRDALCIGTMQSTALLPGISRSASTISCGTLLGWTAKEAVSFSFLLSIPTILGGTAAELLKISIAPPLSSSISFASYIIGFLSSLGVGVVMIGYAVRLLEKGRFSPFAWYCLGLGLLTTLTFTIL